MKHFVLKTPVDSEGYVRLKGEDYHYLVRVRRLKPGMLFDLVLPHGASARASVVSAKDNELLIKCLDVSEEAFDKKENLPFISLIIGMPKDAKFDLIVRQMAEAEVPLIVPFIAEHSIAGRDFLSKLKRWERIIKEARQQSGSLTETVLFPPLDFEGLLKFWEEKKNEYENSLGIFLHQMVLEKGSFHGYLNKKHDFIALAVGPEGGFSQKEIKGFTAAGFNSMYIAGTTLRTETAALYGIAALKTILMESEDWNYLPRG